MISDQIHYLKSIAVHAPRPGKWFVHSKIIQALEREVRGERGCTPLHKRIHRPSRSMREIKGVVAADYEGLDFLMGVTSFYQGRTHRRESLLCMIYIGQGQEGYSPSRAMEYINVPAVGIVGLTEKGIICAGYTDGLQTPKTASWNSGHYPHDPGQIRRVMEGRCAWTLIDKDTEAYRKLPSMVMLLVDAINQSNL